MSEGMGVNEGERVSVRVGECAIEKLHCEHNIKLFARFFEAKE